VPQSAQSPWIQNSCGCIPDWRPPASWPAYSSGAYIMSTEGVLLSILTSFRFIYRKLNDSEEAMNALEQYREKPIPADEVHAAVGHSSEEHSKVQGPHEKGTSELQC
jgi:hypothetical protein